MATTTRSDAGNLPPREPTPPSAGTARPRTAGHRPLLPALLAAAALAGCTTPYVNKGADGPVSQPPLGDPVVFEVSPRYRTDPPRCVAVLPFALVNEDGALIDDDPAGHAARVRRALYAQFAPHAPRDVELSRVDAALRRLPRTGRPDYPAIGRALECDALMVGTVTEYGAGFYGVYSQVAVGADVEIVRAADGEVLWDGRHVARSRAYGLSLSPIGLVRGIWDAVSNVSDEQVERVTDDLARRLVSTLPAVHLAARDDDATPTAAAAAAKRLAARDGQVRPLQAGVAPWPYPLERAWPCCA
ncbi:MAG TPA: hypothetical protein VFG47_16205 [Geminicoccaceae bacterium]|nr:hypothetical protein [Geminicoccaceae bacterium]